MPFTKSVAFTVALLWVSSVIVPQSWAGTTQISSCGIHDIEESAVVTQDRDCTGVDFGGHTVITDLNADGVGTGSVICDGFEPPEGNASRTRGRCEVQNGTLYGGVLFFGRTVSVSDMNLRNPIFGMKVKVKDSPIDAGRRGGTALSSCAITNDQCKVGRMRVMHTTVLGGEYGIALACADVRTSSVPSISSAASCGTSLLLDSGIPGTSCGVCAADRPQALADTTS